MTARFLAISICGNADRENAEYLATSAAALGLDMVCATESLMVLAERGTPTIQIARDRGIIVGELFERGSNAKVNIIDASEAVLVLDSRGSRLVEAYWGAYVALIDDPITSRTYTFPDPMGGVPCYTILWRGMRIVFSGIATPSALGLIEGRIDWSAIGNLLSNGSIRSSSTPLEGVVELLPGQRCSRVGNHWIEDQIWSPWTFAHPDHQIRSRKEAIDLLREEALGCVKAWADGAGPSLVELSGGLDSSIVATCLKEAGANIQCLVGVTPDPGADETRYAHCVADYIGAPLSRVPLTADHALIEELTSGNYPRPCSHMLARVTDIAFEAVGVEQQVGSFFGGAGGDYVLGYLGTSAPAADALITFGPGPQFVKAIRDLAALYRCSVWKVARLALAKAWSKTPAARSPNMEFLAAQAGEGPVSAHPWLDAPEGILPGKIEQVTQIAAGLGAGEGRERDLIAPSRQPLLSQPLVELCLRIPSWMSVEGGRNRAVARDAFANLLPVEIIQRRTKGTFVGLNALIYERNVETLKHLLLGGLLDRAGLLDCAAIEQRLNSTDPQLASYSRLLKIGAAEVWARHWSAAPEAVMTAAESVTGLATSRALA